MTKRQDQLAGTDESEHACKLCGSTHGPRLETAGGWICLKHLPKLGADRRLCPMSAVERCEMCGQPTAGDCGAIAVELLTGAEVMLRGLPESTDRDQALTHLVIVKAALRRVPQTERNETEASPSAETRRQWKRQAERGMDPGLFS